MKSTTLKREFKSLLEKSLFKLVISYKIENFETALGCYFQFLIAANL